MTTATMFPTLRQEIAGFPVSEIVSRFGTPTYVYDAAKIQQRIDDLRCFDVIRYAQKACNNLAILDRMRKAGVVVDAVTTGEVQRAIAAGYSTQGTPPPIVYTADVLDRAGLDIIKKHNLHVNCGSPDMMHQLSEITPGCNVTIRINPGFGHGHSQKTNTGGPQSKHGIWHEHLNECLLQADRHGVMVTGVHMHIGSGTDLEHLAQVCGAMEQAVEQVGRSVVSISAGGGLPVPYREGQSYVDIEQYYQLWDASRCRIQDRIGHAIRLEIEPGRYLVAESGFLVAEIRAVKQMGDNLFYLLDAGFNDLARPILYGAYHPISVVRKNGSTSDATCEAIVAGPLCESGDIFTQEEGGFVAKRRLPLAEVGDWLVLEVAGAYGFVMASNYNGRYRAEEALLEGGAMHSIRKRETFDDLIRGERIP